MYFEHPQHGYFEAVGEEEPGAAIFPPPGALQVHACWPGSKGDPKSLQGSQWQVLYL